MRRITVVGSRLELNSPSPRRGATVARVPPRRRANASRSCSKTWARSSAWAVSPASVDRKRRSGSLGSASATNASDRTPSGPTLPTSGSVTTVTGWARSRRTDSVTSAAMSSALSAPASIVTMSVHPRAKHERRGCRPRAPSRVERSAGCPLLARHERARLARSGDAARRRVRAQSPPATRDRRVGNVARGGGRSERGAELVQVLAALQVDEFRQRKPGPLDGLCRRAGDREEEALVGVRDLAVMVPMHDHGADGVVGHDQRDDGQGAEAGGGERRGRRRAVAPQILERLREERDVVAQHRAVRPSAASTPSIGSSG